MGIELQCECGKQFRVRDDQAGRKVRCPACQVLVKAPGKARAEGISIEASVKCPRCKKHWPAETVVCIDCGWNFKTGRAMTTSYEVKMLRLPAGGTPIGGHYLTLMRGRKGELTLTLHRRWLFIPYGSETIDPREYSTLVTDVVVGDGDTPDWYTVDMEGPRKRKIRVYDCMNDIAMREV